MTLPILNYDMTGNTEIQDAQRFSYDAILNTKVPSISQPYIVTGTGTPVGVLTAPKGTIYIRLDGGAGTMLYVNSAGSTTWQVVTSV